MITREIVENGGHSFSSLTCSATGSNALPGTTFTDKGGTKLSRACIVPVFWGTEWTNSLLAAPIANALGSMIGGPYFSYLVQYGVHRPTLLASVISTRTDPPSPFTTANVGTFITGLLGNNQLPKPDATSPPLIYAVVMPTTSAFQGVVPPDNSVPLPMGTLSKVVGTNLSIPWTDANGNVQQIHYLWVGNNGTLGYITTILSHELAELMTDPNGGSGVVQTNSGVAANANQIGDPCTNFCNSVRGVQVQSYFSISDGQCWVPTVYSVRHTLADRSIGGKISSLGKPIPSLNQLITSLF